MKSLLLVLGIAISLVSPDAVAGRRGAEAGAEAYSRASELHRDKQYAEAAADFIASYQAGYREDASAYNAACALARAGRTDEALKWLQTARDAGFDLEAYLDDDSDLRSLRSDPRFAALRANVLGGRASRHEREGQRLALRYAALEAQQGADPQSYADMGRELLRVGRYDEAGAAFMTAAAHEANPATSIYNAACARSLKGDDKAAALALLQRAVEQGFANPKHLDDDDDLDAIRSEPRFQKIRALAAELEAPGYPSQPRDRNGRSIREWTAALPRLAGAVKNHPQLGQAWFNLGFAGIVLGQPDQAVISFEKAIELGYRKQTSMYNLACSHALAGHVDDAFAWLDKAVANGFDDWWTLRSDADLDSLRSDPRFRKHLDAARAHERQASSR